MAMGCKTFLRLTKCLEDGLAVIEYGDKILFGDQLPDVVSTVSGGSTSNIQHNVLCWAYIAQVQYFLSPAG